MKPQMSDPANEIPARPLLSTAGMDQRMSSQVDLMSPGHALRLAHDEQSCIACSLRRMTRGC